MKWLPFDDLATAATRMCQQYFKNLLGIVDIGFGSFEYSQYSMYFGTILGKQLLIDQHKHLQDLST